MADPMSSPVGPPTVSVVLPAYNEEAIIGDTVTRVDSALRDAGVAEWEILVIDDGSQDQTSERAHAAANGQIPLRVIRHDPNRGYGGALTTGFNAAKLDAVWLMDSDGQFDPDEIALFLPKWQPRVAVFGYRQRRRDPILRRANHTAFFSLVRVVCGPTVLDVNCAFKLFPAELGRNLHAEGAVVSTELVLRARKRGYGIVEIPVSHFPRTTGHATGANPRVVLKAFAELLSLKRDRWLDVERSHNPRQP